MGAIRSMQKHKTLIIGWPVQPKQEWLAQYDNNIDTDRIYKEKVTWNEKKLKDLSFHLPKCLQLCKCVRPSTYYGAWKEHVADYDTIILIDEIRGRDVFEYILQQNPKCNLCVFIDSPVREGSKKEPFLYKDLPVKFFTCDRKIANKYNIDFMPYFYIFSPIAYEEYGKMVVTAPESDVFFVGEEKGDRAKRIAQIKDILAAANLQYDIHLVPQDRRGKKKAAYMAYADVIEHVKRSKAVLELISDGQTGITQRPYEALFLRKKLITTSAEIKHYDFYCEENVFILGERDVQELPRFLNAPLKDVDSEVVAEYTLERWVERFDR